MECFDSGESFLHLGLKLKRLTRFQVAIFFEIDWKTISLVPTSFFPSATRKVLRLKNLSLPLNSSIIDIFSRGWMRIHQQEGNSEMQDRSFQELPSPFILFPLRVKQRVLCAVGLFGLTYKKEEDLDKISDLFHQLSPVLEKNMLIDKTVRRNQRLETIIGLGPTTYFIINRAGYIIEYMPCKNNFLGYTTEEVIRKPASMLFPGGGAMVKALWKQLRHNNNKISGLVNLSSGKKNLAFLNMKKVLMKYTLQKEYYLIGIETQEGELYNNLPSIPGIVKNTLENRFIIRVHLCPENLRCIRMCGKLAQYSGEGRFIIDNPFFEEERCSPEKKCLTEQVLVGNDPDTDLMRK